MVKETAKKKFRKNEKKKWNLFVSLIDLIVMKTLFTARLPMIVSSVQKWFQAKRYFARKHAATHKPTAAQRLIVTTMTHIHLIIVCGAPRPTAWRGNNAYNVVGPRLDGLQWRWKTSKSNKNDQRQRKMLLNELLVESGAFENSKLWTFLQNGGGYEHKNRKGSRYLNFWCQRTGENVRLIKSSCYSCSS